MQTMRGRMDVIILAAGKGTRLGLKDRPKPLADINGRPFITFIFDQLIEAGFKKVIVCISHMAEEKFYELYPNGYESLRIGYCTEAEPMGAGRTLKNAKLWLSEDFVLVINGDTYVDVNIKDYIKDFEESNAVCSIVLHQNINAGMYIIKREFIPYITADEPFHTYSGEFIDIGTPATLEKFRREH